MAIPKSPDYSFKNEIPFSQVLAQAAEKPMREAQLHKDAVDRGQQITDDVVKTTQMAGDAILGMVKRARENQIFSARNELANMLASANTQITRATQTPVPGPVQATETTTTQVPYGQTPEYQNKFKSLLFQADPKAATEAAINQAYPKPATTLEALAARGLQSGQPLDPRIVSTKQDFRNPANEQSKNFLYKGEPAVVDFVPGQGYSIAGEKVDSRDLKPIPGGSGIASIREAALIAKMNMDLPKYVNPAYFAKGTAAGQAANIVQNADSYLGQVENVINGHVIPDRQVMTTLGIDAARTLTQNGVVSERTIHDLIPQSARGKFGDLASWFANEPVGRDQIQFIKNLSTEVRRQRDQKQAIIDRTIGGNLAAFNELRRRRPDDWEQGISYNGLDVEAAKKGHFKLRPEVLSTMYGTTEIPGVTPQKDSDAKAELRKKLGL